MKAFTNVYRRVLGLALIGLAASGILAFQPAVTRAQGSAVEFIPVPGSGFDFRLSPDGKTAATFELGVLQDNWQIVPAYLPIRLFDVTSGKALRTLSGATDYVNSVSFTGDGTQLASVHQNGDLNIWDVSTGKQVKSMDTGVVGGGRIQFFPTGRTLVAGIYDNFRPHMMLWDTESGVVTASLVQHFNTYAEMQNNGTIRQNMISALAISADGKTIATATATDEVWLWDAATKKGTLLAKSEQQFPMLSIRKLAFTSDGKRLVYFNSFNDDRKLHVWDLTDSTESKPLSIGSQAWALAPDGDTIAWVNRGETTVQMAKLSAPDDVTTLDVGAKVTPLPTLEFTADGKRLVIGLWMPNNEEPTNGLYVLTLK